MAYQIISIMGAVVILSAYALQHARRIHAETMAYLVMNLLGGFLLCIAAIAARQYGFILLEGAWALLSAWGVVKLIRAKA